MSPSVAQAKQLAQRDNELVALVFTPTGEVLTFSEPVEDGVLTSHDYFLAIVGLTAQINLGLFLPHLVD